MSAPAPTSAPIVRVERVGFEKQPVVVIDGFVSDPAALRAAAEALAYRPLGPHYPGLRAPVAPADVAAYLHPVGPLIAEVFGAAGGLDVVSAAYSIVTTPPADLTPVQRLPHVDGLEAGRIALLHYLDGAERGGTAFYRHRSTGWETIDAGRHPRYDAALNADVRRLGMPGSAYISGSTPIFERIARAEARPNRALIYRSHLLHCADLPADLDLTPDPRRARLTVNTFLFGHPSPSAGGDRIV